MEHRELYNSMVDNVNVYYVNQASLRLNKCFIVFVGLSMSTIETLSGCNLIINNDKIYRTK